MSQGLSCSPQLTPWAVNHRHAPSLHRGGESPLYLPAMLCSCLVCSLHPAQQWGWDMPGPPPDTPISAGDKQRPSPCTTEHSSQVLTDRHSDRQTWAGCSHSCSSSTEQLEAFGFRPSISSSPVQHEHKRSEPDSQHCQRAGKSLPPSITAMRRAQPALSTAPGSPAPLPFPEGHSIPCSTSGTTWHRRMLEAASSSGRLPATPASPSLLPLGLGSSMGLRQQ